MSKEEPKPLTEEEERAFHRAAVEAGYADLRGYIERYKDKLGKEKPGD